MMTTYCGIPTACYSNYDIFEGFGTNQSLDETKFEEENGNNQSGEVHTTGDLKSSSQVTVPETSGSLPTNTLTRDTNTTMLPNTNTTSAPLVTIASTYSTTKPKLKPKVTCPEEMPTNIGSYEVPTEKDIVMFTKDLLLRMFEAYERDAMTLLLDIKEATKAAVSLENKCSQSRQAYRQCVKRVSGQSQSVTKEVVSSLQLQKTDVADLTNDAVCSLSDMKLDPMSIVKLLAQETVMLKFALPGFLRLLNSCFELCSTSSVLAFAKKPLRRLTDQELVVKYFLKNKNYIELIKDSKRIANRRSV